MLDNERFQDLLGAFSDALDDLARYRQSVTRDQLVANRDRRNMVLHALLVGVQSATESLALGTFLVAVKNLL